jgi:hypothetical protein
MKFKRDWIARVNLLYIKARTTEVPSFLFGLLDKTETFLSKYTIPFRSSPDVLH